MQSQFKIGLALCISKNSKWLSSDQKLDVTEWLNEQIELYGGDETSFIQTKETINVKEVCIFVHQLINQNWYFIWISYN